MAYTVTLQRTIDGALFTHEMDFEWYKDDRSDDFWWREGNFSCDCNRSSLAKDEDESCGHSRYKVRIMLPDGTVPYDEIAAEKTA